MTSAGVTPTLSISTPARQRRWSGTSVGRHLKDFRRTSPGGELDHEHRRPVAEGPEWRPPAEDTEKKPSSAFGPFCYSDKKKLIAARFFSYFKVVSYSVFTV